MKDVQKIIIEELKDKRKVRMMLEGETGAYNLPEIGKFDAVGKLLRILFGDYLTPNKKPTETTSKMGLETVNN